jgi:hypothetical protein
MKPRFLRLREGTLFVRQSVTEVGLLQEPRKYIPSHLLVRFIEFVGD